MPLFSVHYWCVARIISEFILNRVFSEGRSGGISDEAVNNIFSKKLLLKAVQNLLSPQAIGKQLVCFQLVTLRSDHWADRQY